MRQATVPWLNTFARIFSIPGYKALVSCWNKCLYVNGNHMTVWRIPSASLVSCIRRSRNNFSTSVCWLPYFFLTSLHYLHFRFRLIPQLQNLQTRALWRAVFTFCSRLELHWSAQFKQMLISGSLQGDRTDSRAFCSIALSFPFAFYLTSEVIISSNT